MENDIIIGNGKLTFDPTNRTKKHGRQDWKKTAMIMIDDDTHEYYQWFIEKKYPFIQGMSANTKWLNTPLRGPHVTIINDMVGRDFNESDFQRVKDKYDGKDIYFFYRWDGLRNNGEHIYFKVECPIGMEIRKEANLGEPYFDFHLTIGLVPEDSKIKSDHNKAVQGYMMKYEHFISKLLKNR